MHFITTLTSAAVLIATTAAQSTTTTGSAAPTTTGDLGSLVSQLPECALGCLNTAATDIGCKASDLTCLCSKSSQLVSSIGPCILFSSGCSSDQRDQISSLANDLCSDVNASNSTELASASNYINSALATATSVSTSSSSATGNAAARTDYPIAGMGVMGAAAALAALAL
ncbi:GPI-anchored protein 10 [Cytospora mali]|uniref:GPI-anchored protein 10 n=1 Tax=Cytospora mali TaxID=578113 RepID=A0A194UVM4_CYTMA|nr:GPI-anchored protein 10 [Valsa mali var. pyri (nom. inval.)]